MPKKELKTSVLLSILYIALCALAFTFHCIRQADMFSAMFIGILTMPWSICYALLKDFIIAGIFNYEIKYVTHYIVLFFSVLVNTLLIFFISNKFKNK